jgi:2-iminobutanoate/2-iminopropanoate deaminase
MNMKKSYIEGTWQADRAFSPAVITQGGRTIWLAGHGAPKDKSGKSLAGDFEAQTHAVFAALSQTLEKSGGSLQDIVTMTVFILDVRYGDIFVKLRKQYFPVDAPASALITVAGFAQPEMMIEIQGNAVTQA